MLSALESDSNCNSSDSSIDGSVVSKKIHCLYGIACCETSVMAAYESIYTHDCVCSRLDVECMST